MGDENGEERRTQFWLKVGSVVFAAWATMIPVGVTVVTRSVDKIVAQQDDFQRSFNQYVLSMERRITVVEERQAVVIKRLQIHDEDLEYVNGRKRGR